MSKPLELTVFAKEPGRYGREALYNSPDGLWAYPASHADGYAQAKRLTDAELAAEFHNSTADFMSAHNLYMLFEDAESEQKVNDARDWMFCMEHFATLPHYDEQP